MTEQESTILQEHTKLLAELHALVKDGLTTTVKKIRDNMVSVASCEAARKSCAAVQAASNGANTRWRKGLQQTVLIVVAVLTLTFGSGIFFRSCANARQNALAIEQNSEALRLLQELKGELGK
jgi:hypothetical protein